METLLPDHCGILTPTSGLHQTVAPSISTARLSLSWSTRPRWLLESAGLPHVTCTRPPKNRLGPKAVPPLPTGATPGSLTVNPVWLSTEGLRGLCQVAPTEGPASRPAPGRATWAGSNSGPVCSHSGPDAFLPAYARWRPYPKEARLKTICRIFPLSRRAHVTGPAVPGVAFGDSAQRLRDRLSSGDGN